jgi:hypothetical protein
LVAASATKSPLSVENVLDRFSRRSFGDGTIATGLLHSGAGCYAEIVPCR